ncbi:adhesion regulating molecule [Reticulomyxa filosa]|uniref:Adhesion regulating molecule n=1 Tax=Reticulomyxa filosa TaxID=46433 RepID=X6M3U7_RETFI|nr:adhesion regulating molecule [Reticulomyxa filosa]|eukprot:ETO08653.1 adhesion regulating molecule [Reticulomyxa filosa]
MSNAMEIDILLFPDTGIFEKVHECTDGRVFVLRMLENNRKTFIWMQEPLDNNDLIHYHNINRLCRGENQLIDISIEKEKDASSIRSAYGDFNAPYQAQSTSTKSETPGTKTNTENTPTTDNKIPIESATEKITTTASDESGQKDTSVVEKGAIKRESSISAVAVLGRLFDNVDREVIETTLEQFDGNADKAIEALINLDHDEQENDASLLENSEHIPVNDNPSPSPLPPGSRSRKSIVIVENDEKEENKKAETALDVHHTRRTSVTTSVPTRRVSVSNKEHENRKSTLRVLHRMFEQFDKEVMESLFEYKHGNTDKAIEYLIEFREIATSKRRESKSRNKRFSTDESNANSNSKR